MERKGWSGGEGRESMRFWELLLAGFLPSSGGSSLLLSVEVGTWDLVKSYNILKFIFAKLACRI